MHSTETDFNFINRKDETLVGCVRDELIENHVWKLESDAVASDFYTELPCAMDEEVEVTFESFFTAGPPQVRTSSLPPEIIRQKTRQQAG